VKQKGFSLIELMIAIAVLGIITAIAYPSYTNYVRDARRAEAQGAILEAAQWLERQFTVDGSYATSAGAARSISAFNTDFYTLTVATAANTTKQKSEYTIQAAPGGAQSGDSCGTLTITHIGVKGDGDTSQDCWD